MSKFIVRVLVGIVLVVGCIVSEISLACFLIAGALLAGIALAEVLRNDLEQSVLEIDQIGAVNDQHQKK